LSSTVGAISTTCRSTAWVTTIDFCCATGRQGAPKTRLLRSSPDGTLLYWGEKNSDKSVFLDEVREIRLGLDLDPLTPAHLVPSPGSGSAASERAKRGLSKSKSGILYGTETLRRNCKVDDLALSFSLILPTRYASNFV
jgi:hypothetical protein